MRTTQHSQTRFPDTFGRWGLSTLAGIRSPYYVGRDNNLALRTMNLKAFVMNYTSSGGNLEASVFLKSDDNSINTGVEITVSASYSDTETTIQSAAVSAINSFCSSNSLPAPSIDWLITTPPDLAAITPLPMYVSGVAKTGYYAVVGAPSVSGGSGVARFYIDTNGDGTGTAPSAVFTSSLNAMVLNSSNVFVPASITVDTSRKYIDISMKYQTFGTGLAGLLSVITSAVISAAPNGTVVNCFVLVQQ